MKGVTANESAGFWRVVLAVVPVLFVAHTAPAVTVMITSVADTTISENYSNNSFGAMPFVNSGTTQNSNYNRGLFKFDVAGALPAGAKITFATLTLEVVGNPGEEFPSGRFNLHRLLRPWGEGRGTNSPGGGEGQGSTAITNEATWYSRFAFTTNTWTQPGSRAPEDYVGVVSSGVTVGGVDQSPYTIPSTPQMAADLQLWLDQPETNFGWALICQQETTKFTARRFGSREDPNNRPLLEIHFLVPPVIDHIEKLGQQVNLSFVAVPEQNYVVEFRDALPTGSWQPLASIPPPTVTTRVLVVDATGAPRRFYRISAF